MGGFSRSSNKLIAADILLVLVFGCLTIVVLMNADWVSSSGYLVALGGYIMAKAFAIWICSYKQFARFVIFQNENSQIVNSKFSGFSVFKTLLILVVCLGYLFVSYWFLESDSKLIA